ncbi:MAG: winged helix-turn-helix transcriptional regulator, partial [Gammaproteobacteria bacterium]|nr:winged helix-turn-helix transcriptional regulator [Gammaproteobacteria bacterium]
MPRDQTTRDAIRDYVAEEGSATSRQLADYLGITRQAVSLHLRRLLADGEIFKTGSTRAARYF